MWTFLAIVVLIWVIVTWILDSKEAKREARKRELAREAQKRQYASNSIPRLNEEAKELLGRLLTNGFCSKENRKIWSPKRKVDQQRLAKVYDELCSAYECLEIDFHYVYEDWIQDLTNARALRSKWVGSLETTCQTPQAP